MDNLINYGGWLLLILVLIAILFIWFLKKWIPKQIDLAADKKLESHRHELNKELEHLKERQRELTERQLFIHQKQFLKEYDVLNNLWNLALGLTNTIRRRRNSGKDGLRFVSLAQGKLSALLMNRFHLPLMRSLNFQDNY